MIVDEDDEMPDNVGDLRPGRRRPFTVDQNRITLKFWFMPAVPVESVRLPTSENVDSFSVSYVRPSQPNSEVGVADVSVHYRLWEYIHE